MNWDKKNPNRGCDKAAEWNWHSVEHEQAAVTDSATLTLQIGRRLQLLYAVPLDAPAGLRLLLEELEAKGL